MGLSYWRVARLVLGGSDAAALVWALGGIWTSVASWWAVCGYVADQVRVSRWRWRLGVDRGVFGRSCCLGWRGAGGVVTGPGPVSMGTWVRCWVRAQVSGPGASRARMRRRSIRGSFLGERGRSGGSGCPATHTHRWPRQVTGQTAGAGGRSGRGVWPDSRPRPVATALDPGTRPVAGQSARSGHRPAPTGRRVGQLATGKVAGQRRGRRPRPLGSDSVAGHLDGGQVAGRFQGDHSTPGASVAVSTRVAARAPAVSGHAATLWA